MQRVRDCSGGFGVSTCHSEPSFGVHRVVICMNQVVQHTRMVWGVGVNFLKELGCRYLVVKTFGAFSDCPQNGKAVEKLGLIVRKAGVGCSHGVAIGCVARLSIL